MTYVFRFDVIWEHLGYLLAGVSLTMQVTILSILIGLVLGFVAGVSRLSSRRLLALPAAAYIEVFRNTPVLVQLMWIYYCLPIFVGLEMGSMMSSTIALGACAGAYLAEIVRGGILSVAKGEVDAARALGMTHAQALRRVILPQAITTMIPPFTNTFISFLKFSSLVSVLGVADLTYRAQSLSVNTFRPIEMFTTIAAIYFVLCYGIAKLAEYFERRAALTR